MEEDVEDDDEEYGCEYCRNDGRLIEGVCPRCDAWYPEDEEDEPA